MFAIFGLLVFHVLQVKAHMWLGMDDLYIKLSITTQQPVIPGDMATLHVDCRDTNNSKKDIQGLTMTFNLPYFLVYEETITTSGSVQPSSVHSNTGQLVFQFSSINKSENINLDIVFLVMRQDRVPNGEESTSAGQVDLVYQRGNEGCSQRLHTHRIFEILVYNPDCESFGRLGMTDGSIKESQLSVSSVFQILSDKVGHEPYGAGLHREEYWAPAAGLSSHDRRQYVQVDFGSLKNIKMISAQAHPDSKAPIKSMQIMSSNDGHLWKDYSNKNIKFYVTIGALEKALLTALLKMPLTTRWLRISPRSSNGLIGFRFEVYGCSSENHLFSFEDTPLGMESGEITDSQVYSSSNMGSLSVASNARLNLQLMSPSGVGAWCAPAQSEDNWFTVHLVTSHVISAVSTQCRYPMNANGKELFCVTSYFLNYKTEDSAASTRYKENGKAKTFLGNFQRHIMIKHHLIKPIRATRVSFHPWTKLSKTFCMRVELYGRKVVERRFESRMIFPEPQSTMNYAKVENAISSELSKFSICIFVKTFLDLSNTSEHYCVFSYARESARDIVIHVYANRIKFKIGYGSYSEGHVQVADGRWHHVCITWENVEGEYKFYKDGLLVDQGVNGNTNVTVQAGGWAVLGQYQQTAGDGFEVWKAFTGELAEVNLWDMVLAGADVASQYRNCYIPSGTVIQWPQFIVMGEVEIKQYNCTLTSDRPVVYSRAFLVDVQHSRLFVCNTEKSRTKSHCYVTADGKTWTALNHRLLTIHGLDEAGTLHGVYLNGKYFISCDQNGEGTCNVGTPGTWYQARDKASTITAIEVPIYPETGLETTDQPTLPLTCRDYKGRAWGASARGIHLSQQSSALDWKLVLTWRDYDFDECASSTCENRGTCVVVDDGFVCFCLAGWTGRRCEGSVDECASNPCQHGGTCIDKHLSYKCMCAAGYTGTDCERSVDECASNPCQHGGTCLDENLSYRCTCVAGYTGTECETDINECESEPCVNGGRCTDNVGRYTCSCPRGYRGVNCHRDIDECSKNPCNSGDCQNNPGSYSCNCYPGWLGSTCDVQDFCYGHSNCSNGATCENRDSDYECLCKDGWTGYHCDIELVEICYNNEVGVANSSIIPDNQMSASTQYNDSQAAYGRLNYNRGGWCAREANRTDDWLQVDFNRTVQVCGVATQGYNDGENSAWVESFELSFSSDEKTWTTYEDADEEMEFLRTGDFSTVDQHKLPLPVSARFIRFHPIEQHAWNCLRVEVYGIDDPCYRYGLLDEADRKRSYIFNHSRDALQCDDGDILEEKAWYRLSENAGGQMTTSCVPRHHCNTDVPGWLSGDHPTTAQGIVNMKVCFYKQEDCCFFHRFISVKNCGNFYVYELVRLSCFFRYCGAV